MPCPEPATDRSRRSALPLPLAVRALTALGGSSAPGRRDELALRAVRARVRGDRAYRSRAGFSLRVDPADPFQARMLLGSFDPAVTAVVERYCRPGATAIDAGAHLGYLTLHMARAVGPRGAVHAFECDPRLAGRLREHVALNGFDWVRVSEAALLDRSRGEVTLRLTDQLGWATVKLGVWPEPASIPVPATTLDDHLSAEGVDPCSVGFIKVDVEGAELEALRGMAATLAAASPPVLAEYIPWRMRAEDRDPEELLDLMREHGYRPWSIRADPRAGLRLLPGVGGSEGDDVLFLRAR